MFYVGRQKSVETENARLKRLPADAMLDSAAPDSFGIAVKEANLAALPGTVTARLGGRDGPLRTPAGLRSSQLQYSP